MAKKLVVEIVGDEKGFSAALTRASGAARSFSGRVQHLGEGISHVGERMVLMGAATGAVAGEIGKKLVESAVAAQEQTGKLDQAMRNAGISAEQAGGKVAKLEASNRKLGFTNADTRDSLTKLIQSGESMTKATTDMALAQDYARVKGISLAEATSAVVKVHQGLLRPLKELGISLPAATDHMKALTDAHKKSKTAITATERALAFQQDKEETGAQAIALMTKKLHGQAEEFSKSAAGGMARFHAQMGDIQERMGTSLLPIVEKLTSVIAGLADKFNALSPHTQKMIALGVAVAAAAGVAVSAIGTIVTAIGGLTTALGFLAANPIVLVIAGVALLAAAVAAAVIWPDKLKSVLEHMGLSAQRAGQIVSGLQQVFKLVEAASERVAAVVRANWPQIQAIIKGAADIITTAIRDAVAIVQAIWSRFHTQLTTIARTAWSYLQGTIKNALTQIRGVIDIVGGLMHGDWSRVWQGIKEVVSGAVGQMLNVLRSGGALLGALASIAGKAIKAGVLHPIGELLTAAGEKIAQLIGWFKLLPAKIVAALGDLSTLLLSAGADLMKGLVKGIESKLGDVKTSVIHAAHKAAGWFKGALGVKSPSTVFASIGSDTAQGFIVGLESRYKDVNGSMKNLGSAAGIQVAIQQAGRILGIKTAEAIAAGFVQGQPTLEQQIKQGLADALGKAKQAVVDARTSFASAFASMAQDALSAFDQKMAAWVPPALKLYDRMQLQDQVNQAKQAITDATQQLADAQKSANDIAASVLAAQAAGPKDGESQADYQARLAQLGQQYLEASKQITTAEKALGDAKRAQQELNYQLEAQKEQAAHDKRVARQRENLAKQLLALQQDLAKHPMEWDKAQQKILATLRKYDVPMFNAGQKIASQFAGGLLSEVKAVESAAETLAQAVAKYIVTHSPAKAGPLSEASPFDLGARIGKGFNAGLAAGLYAGSGLGTLTPRLTRSASFARSGGAGIAARGGDLHVHVHAETMVGGDVRTLARELGPEIREELTRMGKRDGNIFGGWA